MLSVTGSTSRRDPTCNGLFCCSRKRAGCSSVFRTQQSVGGPTQTDMMAALLLWILSAGALLFSSDALTEYDKLPDNYKKGVDLALEEVHSHPGIQLHFMFFESVKKSALEHGFDVSYINHHFSLKATKCPKGTVDSSKCQFRRDRPLIDCVVCYKTFSGEIEPEPQPFVHCVHKPALTEEMMTTRDQKCKAVGYNSGSIMPLSSTQNE